MVFRVDGGSQASYHTTNKIMDATQTTRRTIKRPAMKLKVADDEVVPRPPTPEVPVEPESSEPESSDDETESVRSETESVRSEPESEDAECQTDPLPEAVTERRVYDVVDEQVQQCTEDFEEKLADLRRQMMEETERMIAQKLATLAGGHPTIQKQTKKAEKEKKKEEEVRGYYAVPAGVDEIARLRKINAELRKESEGKTNTNRKLQEKIDNLESEEPVARYVAEIKKVREANQVLRKRCEAKDRTYQKMKAMIEALGGKAPEAVRDEDEE
jgi:hypothetical protein